MKPVQPDIAKHTLWQEARRWIRAEKGSQNQSRFCFRSDTPETLLRELSAIQCPCRCGQLFWPVRRAENWSTYSLHVTGEKKLGHGRCFAGNFSRERVLWLQLDLSKAEQAPRTIQGRKESDQKSLFDTDDMPGGGLEL